MQYTLSFLQCAASFEPQNVSLSSRIKESPDQHLSINKGELLQCMQRIPVPIICFSILSNKDPHCMTSYNRTSIRLQ